MSTAERDKEAVRELVNQYGWLRNASVPSLNDSNEEVTWSEVNLSDREVYGLRRCDEYLRVKAEQSNILLLGIVGCVICLLSFFGIFIAGSQALIGLLIGGVVIALSFGAAERRTKAKKAQAQSRRDAILQTIDLKGLPKTLSLKLAAKTTADEAMLKAVQQRTASIKKQLFNKSLNENRIEVLKIGLKLGNTALAKATVHQYADLVNRIQQDHDYFKKRWETYLKDKPVTTGNQPVTAKPTNKKKAAGGKNSPDQSKKYVTPKESAGGSATTSPSQSPPSPPARPSPAPSPPAPPAPPPPAPPLPTPSAPAPSTGQSSAPAPVFEFDPTSDPYTINEADHTAKAELGRVGEAYALKYERQRINALGKRIKHLRQISTEKSGDRYGYDIYSETTDGEIRRIEVKATKANKADGFFLTDNELRVLRNYLKTYYIYRLSDYDEYGYSDVSFVVDEIRAEKLLEEMELIPKTYAVKRIQTRS